MDKDVERQRMQEYLSIEISESDRLEFQAFLESIKPNGGIDIDIWSYEEIVAAVDKFKKTRKNKEQNPLVKKGSMAKESEITPSQDSSFNNKVKPQEIADNRSQFSSIHEQPIYNKVKSEEFIGNRDHFNSNVYIPQPSSSLTDYKIVPYEPLKHNFGISKKVKCKQLARTKLDQEGVVCRILDSETVKGGIFSANYVVYIIETIPYKWLVKRRYSDFDWLRNTLSRTNLGCVIPPLSGKKMGKGLDSQTTLKRKYFLERFLRDILKSPVLRNNPIVTDFLELPDESLFNKKKKETDYLVKPPKLEFVTNLTGELDIGVNENLGLYLNEVSSFFENSEAQYKKIKKLSDQLVTDLEKVYNTFSELSEAFSIFEKNSNNMNKNLNFGKMPKLPQVFAGMNNFCAELGKSVEEKISFIQENFATFFKYNKNMTFAVMELIKEKNTNFSDCAKMEKKVLAQKEKSNADGIPVKYIDGHASDVMILSNMEEKFGFLSNRMFHEFSRILHYKCEGYLEHISKMTKEYSDRIKKEETRMRNINMQLSEVNLRPVFNTMSIIKRK